MMNRGIFSFSLILFVFIATISLGDNGITTFQRTRLTEPDSACGNDRQIYSSYTVVKKQQPLVTSFNGDSVAIIIDSVLYDSINAAIDTFLTDLGYDGYTAWVVLWSGTSAADLRNYLQDEYADGMAGAVFIGDLPVVWGWDSYRSQYWPCDRYYMDMNSNYVFDSTNYLISWPTAGPVDIYMGRLYASTLTYRGDHQADLIKDYFRKNHRYRTWQLELEEKGLLFNTYGHTDSVTTCVECDYIARAYDETECIWDSSLTKKAEYINQLERGLELIQLESSGNPNSHSMDDNPFRTEDLLDSTCLRTHFLMLQVCQNSRYTAEDYLSGWYIFASDSFGLWNIGNTWEYAGWDDSLFWNELGNGGSVGQALVAASRVSGTHALLGDPTLAIDPPGNFCCDVAGDVTHDGSVTVGDPVYLINYIFKAGPCPPCLPEADANGDCDLNTGDTVYLINYVFKTGPPPVECDTTNCVW